MSLLLILLAAQAVADNPYGPEIEAILRRRDETRQRAAIEEVERKREASALAAVLPPDVADRLARCLARADEGAEAGLAEAASWAGQGGGAFAAQCKGYALARAERWSEAAIAFESGAMIKGLDPVAQGRLLAQAGNAAMVAGDPARALGYFDRAFDLPLPATLSTGELRLDRARARVATGDLAGARGDLAAALSLASGDPLAWLLSATLARRMDDLALARTHIEKAATLARGDAAVALEQGVIYALSGDRDPAARAAFQRAAELAPGSDTAKTAAAYLAQLPAEAAAR